MEVKIKLENIDHESVINMILPVIARKNDAIEDRTLSNFVSFADIMNVSSDSLTKMLDFIPQDVKDNIIFTLLITTRILYYRLLKTLLKRTV